MKAISTGGLKVGMALTLAGVFSPPAMAADGAATVAALPAPPAGQGQIVFWRPGSIVGAALGCGVNQGTERISALGRGKYFLLNLAPGAYEFNAKSEAKDTLNLEVEEGEVYYVKCTIRMGIMTGRPNLAPSNAAEFSEKKAELKYVDADDVGPRVAPDPGNPSGQQIPAAEAGPVASETSPNPEATTPAPSSNQ